MRQDIDPDDQAARDAESDLWLEAVFQNWQVGRPIPSPSFPVYEFSESALYVGHLRYPPRDTLLPNPNREDGAKAYLMVKRDRRQTGFLWCDADGEPVDKKYIQMDEGLNIRYLKGCLASLYNTQERRLVAKWNREVKVATLRRAIQRVQSAGPSEPPVVHADDYL